MADVETVTLSKRVEYIRDRAKSLHLDGLDEAAAKTQAIIEADKKWPMKEIDPNRGLSQRTRKVGDMPRPKYPYVGGIVWIGDRKRWEVVCTAHGKRVWVGRYEPHDYVTAVAAWNKKQMELRTPKEGASKQIDLEKIRAAVEQANRDTAASITTE